MRTLTHITYHGDWPFVTAAYVARAVIGGEEFTKTGEANLNSVAVMSALLKLEGAILAELGEGATSLRAEKLARKDAAALERAQLVARTQADLAANGPPAAPAGNPNPRP